MADTLLGFPLVVRDKDIGGGDIKLGALDDYIVCEDCGHRAADHIAIPGGFPSCNECTKAWHRRVMCGDPDAAPLPEGIINVTGKGAR